MHLDDATPVVLRRLGDVQYDLGLLFYSGAISNCQLGLDRHLWPRSCQTGWLNILLVLCTAARKAGEVWHAHCGI